MSPTWQSPAAVPVDRLGTSTADAIWLGVRAEDRLREEARLVGLTEAPGDDVITLSPGAIATADALRRFRALTDGLRGDVVGTIEGPAGDWGREPAFGPPARLVRLRGGGPATPERLDAAATVTLEVEHRLVRVKLADAPGGRTTEIASAEAVLCSTGQWCGLLWANLLPLGHTLWGRLVGGSFPVAAFRGALAWLKTRSTDPFVLAGALNAVEAGVRIHPSAVVEGAWIGRGATIGPGAVVRGAIVGAGASVEAQALVQFAVLGPESHVQRRGFVQYAVLHPGAAVAGSMQLGVLGPGATVKHGAALMDQALEGEVRAEVGGQLVRAPLGVLGVGVGARTVIGAGVHVAPGRTLPPDLRVAPSGGEVLRRVPAGVSGAVVVRDGGLVPR